MAADPAPSTEATLDDGAEIHLREVLPTDRATIQAGFERLSPESRYRRFFTSMSRLSESDLTYLTEVAHRDQVGGVAFDDAGGRVGVARYVRVEPPTEAEVAVAVVDEWQGRGAGTALLERLVARARENGIERFVATVLAENEDALELFRSLSPADPSPRPGEEPGQLNLVIELPADGVRGTLLGRALRTAASGRVVIHPWRLIKERLQAIAEARARGENRPNR
jgi:GNAT superfamily N-acetyltransferase